MRLGKGLRLASVAYTAAAFYDFRLGARACSCPEDGSLCDAFSYADVVIHAKALSRASEESDPDTAMFADVTYTVEVIKTYKGEDGEDYDSPISFTTSASSSLCGIYLDVGEEDGGDDNNGLEYLLDLTRYGSSGELRAVGTCGAFKEWSEADDTALEDCTLTPSPGLSSTQEIQAESGDNDSSAERLDARRTFVAAGAIIALCSLGSVLLF